MSGEQCKKGTIMKKKMVFMGMLALALSALVLAGCETNSDDDNNDSYTFRFKVDNKSSNTITTIEFINGSNKDRRVLKKVSALNLGYGELSDEYKVSGFTGEYGTNERYYGVLVTYEDGTAIFGYWHCEQESKILVTSTDDYWTEEQKIVFSPGLW
jgi:hypothetical protein